MERQKIYGDFINLPDDKMAYELDPEEFEEIKKITIQKLYGFILTVEQLGDLEMVEIILKKGTIGFKARVFEPDKGGMLQEPETEYKDDRA